VISVGRLESKVAFITGASRGQGRSHAVRMAEEGAAIIGVDICEDIAGVPYELGTRAELEETRGLVEAPDFIRASSIHPSSTFTKMINNPAIWEVFALGVENPSCRGPDRGSSARARWQ
jgi:hypothetical protein